MVGAAAAAAPAAAREAKKKKKQEVKHDPGDKYNKQPAKKDRGKAAAEAKEGGGGAAPDRIPIPHQPHPGHGHGGHGRGQSGREGHSDRERLAAAIGGAKEGGRSPDREGLAAGIGGGAKRGSNTGSDRERLAAAIAGGGRHNTSERERLAAAIGAARPHKMSANVGGDSTDDDEQDIEKGGAAGAEQAAASRAPEAAHRALLARGRRRARLVSLALLLVVAVWVVLSWFVFQYGLTCYALAGPDFERPFAADFGVGLALDQAWELRRFLFECLRALAFVAAADPLRRGRTPTEALESLADTLSVQAALFTGGAHPRSQRVGAFAGGPVAAVEDGYLCAPA